MIIIKAAADTGFRVITKITKGIQATCKFPFVNEGMNMLFKLYIQ